MDKEAAVHIPNGILLSHKKEQIWICSKEMDKPRAYYTDWSKSEREIWISYTDTYIWNLKRWHWWIYFQGRNGEIDIDKRCMDKMGGEEGGGEMYGKSNIEIYNTICKTDSQWEFDVWPRELKLGLCDRWGWEGDGRKIWKGGEMGVPIADSCWVWQKTTKFCEAIILQLKKIFLKRCFSWTHSQTTFPSFPCG